MGSAERCCAVVGCISGDIWVLPCLPVKQPAAAAFAFLLCCVHARLSGTVCQASCALPGCIRTQAYASQLGRVGTTWAVCRHHNGPVTRL